MTDTTPTDTAPEHPGDTTAGTELPVVRDRRWDKSRWHSGRLLRLAALVVTLAGVVFIVAVIFWSGFVLGACEGGGHHYERDSGQEGGGSDEQHDGMAPFGVVVERTMSSVGFAG